MQSSSCIVHLLSKQQNHEEDFFKFCVLLRKSELKMIPNFLQLSSGDVKEDLSLGKSEDGMGWDTVGIELLKRFEDGEEIKVVVQEILGKEYILEVRAD